MKIDTVGLEEVPVVEDEQDPIPEPDPPTELELLDSLKAAYEAHGIIDAVILLSLLDAIVGR